MRKTSVCIVVASLNEQILPHSPSPLAKLGKTSPSKIEDETDCADLSVAVSIAMASSSIANNAPLLLPPPPPQLPHEGLVLCLYLRLSLHRI